jgi:hypothetical protein
MSTTFVLIILAVSFITFVICMYKGFNAMLCFLIISVLWSLITGGGLKGTLDMIAKGTTTGASTMLLIVLGSWFGHIMLETGIIKGIINKAIEFSGGKPYVVCSLLCLVTAFIFVTGYGSGVVIAVGVIVLPIMFSLRVPKVLAASAFALSIGSGLFLNPTIYNLTTVSIQKLISEESKFVWQKFAFVPMIISTIVTVAGFIISLHRSPEFKTSAWTADIAGGSGNIKSGAPMISFIIPLVPIVIYLITRFNMIAIYYFTFLLTLFLTGNLGKGKHPLQILVKSLKDGVSDVAVLYGYIVFLSVFIEAAGVIRGTLGEAISGVLPHSPIVLAIAIVILAPLGLYRGPLAPAGGGAALMGPLVALNVYPESFLLGLFMLLSVCISFGFCPTVGWNAWITSYTEVKMSSYLKRCLTQQWPLLAVLAVIVCIVFLK